MSPDPVRQWLRATLASLPEAVTSLSVGGTLDEGFDPPRRTAMVRGVVRGEGVPHPCPSNNCCGQPEIERARAALDVLEEEIDERAASVMHLLPVAGWVTVTREELAAEGPHVVDRFVSLTREGTEDGVLAAIVEEIRDLPDGEATTIRVRRSDEGALTWAVVEP